MSDLNPDVLKYKKTLRNIRLSFDWDSYVRENHTIKPSPGEEIRICCFSCGENKYKLYVNPNKKKFHCFKCDFSSGKYDVFDFVAKTENITRWNAIKRLYREYAPTTPDELEEGWENSHEVAVKTDEPLKVLQGLPDGVHLLEADITPENAEFWRYVSSRGIYEEEALGMRLHYVPDAHLGIVDSNGKYRGDIGHRLVIPIYGGNHELVSWQARAIEKGYDKHDKYLTAPQSELTKTLWPYVKPGSNSVILVEGVLDCLAVRRIDNTACYATFSKKISKEQIKLLKHWGVEEVTVFWDRKDAFKEIKSAVEELKLHFVKVFVLDMKSWPKDKDAGDMLADPEGTDKLKEVLVNRIDTYDPLEMMQWELTF